MKKLIILNLITFFIYSAASAQTADDSKLLEYYQSQRYTDAANYLKENNPEPIANLKVLSRLAYTMQLANRLPEAEAYYQRVYDLDTTNQGALFNMGSINLKRGNYLKAETYYQKIADRDTANFAAYKQLGTIANFKKDTLAEIKYLQKANKLNNQDIDVVVDLANCYISQKAFDPALKILKIAAEGDPDNVYILLSMATITFKQKLWTPTIQTCNKLIALGATDDQVYYKMGVSYFNLKNYACGAECLGSIPDAAQTEYSYYFAAECYKGLKDYHAAITLLNKALTQAISFNTSSYYAEIADSNEKLGQTKKAMQAYHKGLQFKDDPAIYNAIGDLYTKLKDKADASKYYRLAAQAYQKTLPYSSAIAIYTLASLYDAQLKDTANAIKYYRKYLDTKPPLQQKQFIDFTQSRIGQLQKN